MYDVTIESRASLADDEAIEWALRRGRACARVQAFLDRVEDPLVVLRVRVETTHSDSRVGFDPLFLLRILRDGSEDRTPFEAHQELLDGAIRGTFRAERPSPLLLATVEYRGGEPDSPVSAGLQDAGTYELLTTEPFARSLRDTYDSAAWPGLEQQDDATLLARTPEPVTPVRAELAWLESGTWLDRDGTFERIGEGITGHVRGVAIDPSAVVWATTSEGLFRCSHDGVRTVHVGRKGSKQQLTPLVVLDGVVWVGSYTGGLFGLYPDGAQENIKGGKGKPLPSPNVTHLSVGDDGALLIGTRKGVVRRDPSGDLAALPDGDASFVVDRSVVPVRGAAPGGWYVSPNHPSAWSLCEPHSVLVHADGRALAPHHPASSDWAEYFRSEQPQAYLRFVATTDDHVALGGSRGVMRLEASAARIGM